MVATELDRLSSGTRVERVSKISPRTQRYERREWPEECESEQTHLCLSWEGLSSTNP